MSNFAEPINIVQWNWQRSTGTNPVLTLSSTFANNNGPNVVTVRSGALSISAGTFPSSGSPRGFYTIGFTTPFTYTGGEVVVTMRHTSHAGSSFLNDAVNVGALGNTLGNVFDSTTGSTNFFHFPVTRFTVTPEPGSLVLAAIGVLAASARRRRRASLP